jgi:hypothetical protein
MSNWDDIDEEDLYALHDILSHAANAKEEKNLIDRLRSFDDLHELLKRLSTDFIIKISNKITEIIHDRAKKKFESQENT